MAIQKKILVADDSSTIQKVIKLALAGESYDIQTVSEGSDAIQQIYLNKPAIVLIDIYLPGKSASEVKAEINLHKDLDDIRFILLMSAFEKNDSEFHEPQGFHAILTKPFDPAFLRSKLSELCQSIDQERQETTTLLKIPALAEISPPPPAPPPSPELLKPTSNEPEAQSKANPQNSSIDTSLGTKDIQILTEMTFEQSSKTPPLDQGLIAQSSQQNLHPLYSQAVDDRTPSFFEILSPAIGYDHDHDHDHDQPRDQPHDLPEKTLEKEWTFSQGTSISLVSDTNEQGAFSDSEYSPNQKADEKEPFSEKEDLIPPLSHLLEEESGVPLFEPHLMEEPLASSQHQSKSELQKPFDFHHPENAMLQQWISEEIEEQIKLHIQMILPEIAEKLLKNEIHRLLTEHFSSSEVSA